MTQAASRVMPLRMYKAMSSNEIWDVFGVRASLDSPLIPGRCVPKPRVRSRLTIRWKASTSGKPSVRASRPLPRPA